MIYLLTFKELYSFQEYIFIHKKYLHSSKLYSFKELYTFQGNYIHSRKLYSFKELSSFIAFPDIAEIFIQQVSPATL